MVSIVRLESASTVHCETATGRDRRRRAAAVCRLLDHVRACNVQTSGGQGPTEPRVELAEASHGTPFRFLRLQRIAVGWAARRPPPRARLSRACSTALAVLRLGCARVVFGRPQHTPLSSTSAYCKPRPLQLTPRSGAMPPDVLARTSVWSAGRARAGWTQWSAPRWWVRPVRPARFQLAGGQARTAPHTCLLTARLPCIARAQVLSRTQPLRVVLVVQFRPPIHGYCLEMPAGMVDAGESPEQAALRELREETGGLQL